MKTGDLVTTLRRHWTASINENGDWNWNNYDCDVMKGEQLIFISSLKLVPELAHRIGCKELLVLLRPRGCSLVYLDNSDLDVIG